MTVALRWPTSLRWRLTLRYTLLLALPLIAFSAACYVVVARTLENRSDVFISDALATFARDLESERRTKGSMESAMLQTVHDMRFRALRIAIVDSAGVLVALTEPPEAPASATPVAPRVSPDTDQFAAALLAEVRRHQAEGGFVTSTRVRGDDIRLLARRLDIGARHFLLVGAYDLAEISEVTARVRSVFLTSIPVLLLLAALGSNALARRFLAPLSAMSAQASSISVSNLHERLPVEGGDELENLATVANGLLDRLEDAFDQQRKFVADASHELRTPVAVVNTEADITLSREHRDEAEYRASVDVMRDAARRMSRIVDDLFLLSRADAGHLVMKSELIYLDELVQDVTRAMKHLASQRGVDIVVHELDEAPFVGDSDLVNRLILNLVDNAVKYSPRGGVVGVSLTQQYGEYDIRVSDNGPGIPREARERVFERFYRVDAARSRAEASKTSGAGLGLAIARRIAEMHGGHVDLDTWTPGNTQFVITMPVPPLTGEGAAPR